MKNALILHGTDADHTANWFPWLEKQLQKNGYKVWTPDLPQSDIPNIKRYNEFIFPRWKFDRDSILIGHSSGAVAILGILDALPADVVVRAAYLIAGFTDDLGWVPLKELFQKPFHWEKIKKQSLEFILYHSNNDPHVALRYGEELRNCLSGELIVMKGQGHFNLEKGPQYKKFPELLEKILE